LTQKDELVSALQKEMEVRRDYLNEETIETIYFGGGTPSILSIEELERLLQQAKNIFQVDPSAEITLEANPDDISAEILAQWKSIRINRLSIGVQSFFEVDLQWMNRAHNAQQAIEGLKLALTWFDNISIDLIYGSPGLSNEKWEKNVQQAIELNIPHISCYALTVEPKTPLAKMIREKRSANVDTDKQSEQFFLLMDWLEAAGYEHYEISNFAKPGYRSRHNSSYWGSAPGKGKKYLGIGPSAHSFNGKERQWNVSNNSIYIRAIQEGNVYAEMETLTSVQELNEYIMTALRTKEGIQLNAIDPQTAKIILKNAEKFIKNGALKMVNQALILTREGKLLADGIASSLFF
jgi:oxygen-independent coproporphyrinogen-3 oxidase